VTARSESRGEEARQRLVERVGRDPFEVVAIDMGKADTVAAAISALADRGGRIDYALLNAGLVSGSEVVRTDVGIEITVAASLIGHHSLTMGLLDQDLLTDEARIVIAGSEAARGDVPTMGLTDVGDYARDHHDGDRAKAIVAISRVEGPYVYKNMPHYAMTKLFLAWWTAALSRRLPKGMTINAISPGSAPATSAMRNQPWLMQWVVRNVLVPIGPYFGMAAPLSVAAARYLDAIDYGPDNTGHFYASKPGKMTGPVEIQQQPHVLDFESQEAAWHAVIELSGSQLPAARQAAV